MKEEEEEEEEREKEGRKGIKDKVPPPLLLLLLLPFSLCSMGIGKMGKGLTRMSQGFYLHMQWISEIAKNRLV